LVNEQLSSMHRPLIFDLCRVFCLFFWPLKVRRQVYGIDIATTNSGVAYADSFVLKEHHRQKLCPNGSLFQLIFATSTKGAITK
jgi:hypothetical protein